MENVIIEMPVEIILAIIIPLIPAVAMVIRYFWKKEKCFVLMKQKIDELSKSESGSQETHDNFYEKFDEYGNRLTSLETKVDIMLETIKKLKEY